MSETEGTTEIGRLERRLRQWKYATIVAVALSITAFGRVEIASWKGEPATSAVPGVDSHGQPCLAMSGSNGRIQIGVNQRGFPGIWLFDATDTCRACLGLNPDGAPCLNLFDSKGIPRAELTVVSKDFPLLAFHDEHGPRLTMAGTPDGDHALSFLDEEKNPLAVLASTGLGPALVFFDDEDRIRVELGSSRKEGPGLVLVGADGEPVFRVPR